MVQCAPRVVIWVVSGMVAPIWSQSSRIFWSCLGVAGRSVTVLSMGLVASRLVASHRWWRVLSRSQSRRLMIRRGRPTLRIETRAGPRRGPRGRDGTCPCRTLAAPSSG